MALLNALPMTNGHKFPNGGKALYRGIPKARPWDEVPNLASRLYVERSEKAFGSRAISLVDLPAGSLFARITNASPAVKAYTSVQTSENDHIELNSDLVYCNHSCDPSLIFDMSRFEIRVAPHRDLKKGDALTFWYPSSEWEMDQPFDCTCGSSQCKGRISGAKDLSDEILREYWLNDHIERMIAARAAAEYKPAH
ncbi:uncharacterized protein PV09_08283 [Verruconis gallopava]|uniref:Post-SET domain-containing protein n=1 Tax=Verruconis gallopava TaxID=253628 RepID=A0A0D1YH14_9PEZI|nr:uncharacterized protein PV09_08283 [Verruconis gallopava]KIW00097.1 hypothetical protein PV09_08283 [Verruconis gallopava]